MSQLGFQLQVKDLTPTERFIKRLTEHRRPIAQGASIQEIRTAILAGGCDFTIFGRAPNRKPETYAQAFERLFGEPLNPKTRKGTERKSTC